VIRLRHPAFFGHIPAHFPRKAFLRDETGAYSRVAMEQIGPFVWADWIDFFLGSA
jgi:hypothetical protein